MLAHYSSNRFIQRATLVVLLVSCTLVVGSPANFVDVDVASIGQYETIFK